jgi:hypothetical protein
MLKSEAEHILRRASEDTGAEFSEEQYQALSIAIMKIAGRLVEEAVASWRPRPGSRPNFFTE